MIMFSFEKQLIIITSQARPGNNKEEEILAVIVRPVRNILRTKKVKVRYIKV